MAIVSNANLIYTFLSAVAINPPLLHSVRLSEHLVNLGEEKRSVLSECAFDGAVVGHMVGGEVGAGEVQLFNNSSGFQKNFSGILGLEASG